MPFVLSVSLPLIMAAVLVASGIAKLRHPDDLAGWRELGVPAQLRQRWLLQLHPWGEIVLGAALAVLGGVLGLIAALIAAALMGAYTVLIVQVLRRRPDASCACFGEPAPVTRGTVVRNVWLTLVALASAAVIWATPLWGGAVLIAFAFAWGLVVVLAVAAVTAVVIVRPTGRDAAADAGSASPAPQAAAVGDHEDDDDDYVRVRTPGAPVTLGDGTVVTLRDLTTRTPILLLLVSETCGSCQPVIESIDRYRALLPELEVRFLLASTPQHSSLTSTVEPQTLHDPDRYFITSIADRIPTPTAILLGADGMLAGGPETGTDAVAAFVDDIYESLHGVRPGADSLL